MEKENEKMKTNEETRSGTAKLANRETNSIYSTSEVISISETAKAMLREMDKNTPSNELLLRGWS
jgi:hypothetical protein